MISALERWTLLADYVENKNPEALRRLRARIAEEREADQRKPGLFLVRKPARKPEQLDLDFTGESQREVERVM